MSMKRKRRMYERHLNEEAKKKYEKMENNRRESDLS